MLAPMPQSGHNAAPTKQPDHKQGVFMPLAVNDQTFDQEVKQSQLPVLVDFWGEGCPPCGMLAPIIEELSREYEGKVKIVKVNVGEAPEIATTMNIMGVPTLAVFQSGEEKLRHTGFIPKDKIVKELLSKV